MRKNLTEVYKVLRKDGRYIVVVGNNRIRGHLFENWKYLMPIAEKIGFEVETYFGSEIIKHFIKVPREERINTDWVLVLKKIMGNVVRLRNLVSGEACASRGCKSTDLKN